MTSPPKWALEMAQFPPNSVVAWVGGVEANKRFPRKLLLLVTANEIVCLTVGFLTQQVRRAPKGQVTSMAYNTGIELDIFAFRIPADDSSIVRMQINRRNRSHAWKVLEELHKGVG